MPSLLLSKFPHHCRAVLFMVKESSNLKAVTYSTSVSQHTDVREIGRIQRNGMAVRL